MRFLKLLLAYDGTDYAGWQVQPHATTVQGTLEAAWQQVTGEVIRATASGRTDAGVHALELVVSLSSSTHLDEPTLVRALNANLPNDIRVLQITPAPERFHAIRCSVAKRYRYLIGQTPRARQFHGRYCWSVRTPLDVDAMRAGAAHLVGRHDFASFQTSGSERLDTTRTIHELTIEQVAQQLPVPCQLIAIEVEGDGFLYNMVRNIVGTLVQVGRGAMPPEWVAQVLAARNRSKAGPTAPPQGLFLVQVTCDPTL